MKEIPFIHAKPILKLIMYYYNLNESVRHNVIVAAMDYAAQDVAHLAIPGLLEDQNVLLTKT